MMNTNPTNPTRERFARAQRAADARSATADALAQMPRFLRDRFAQRKAAYMPPAPRLDTETQCHCASPYGGSDHCPACGCEQYETPDCGHAYDPTAETPYG